MCWLKLHRKSLQKLKASAKSVQSLDFDCRRELQRIVHFVNRNNTERRSNLSIKLERDRNLGHRNIGLQMEEATSYESKR